MKLAWVLIAVFGAACGGEDLCGRSVQVAHKLESELEACFPDAGIPPDTETDTEVSRCETQVKTCTSQDLDVLNQQEKCFEDLAPFNCQWIAVVEDSGAPPIAAGVWGLQFLSCLQPPQPLSSTCQVTNPIPLLDAGFPFDAGF